MVKDVIVITKGSRVSVFSTLSKALAAYGWKADYNKLRNNSYPFDHNDHRFQKIPAGVTVTCFELVDAVVSKKSAKTVEKREGKWKLYCIFYDREYVLEIEHETKHEEANLITTDRGMEEESPAMDYDVAVGIEKATKITEDGEVVLQLDEWTTEQILNCIDLKE